ncbi:MAG: hypothetical protein AAF624_09095, partial [Bacteroidota bacterium]
MNAPLLRTVPLTLWTSGQGDSFSTLQGERSRGWTAALSLTLALLLAACDRDPQAMRPQDGVDVLAY